MKRTTMNLDRLAMHLRAAAGVYVEDEAVMRDIEAARLAAGLRNEAAGYTRVAEQFHRQHDEALAWAEALEQAYCVHPSQTDVLAVVVTQEEVEE